MRTGSKHAMVTWETRRCAQVVVVAFVVLTAVVWTPVAFENVRVDAAEERQPRTQLKQRWRQQPELDFVAGVHVR